MTRRPKDRRPIGGGGARNPASLANLQPGRGAAGPGNSRALSHGAYSAQLLADVSAEVQELMAALAAAAPVREVGGELPAADLVAVEVAARALKRYRHIAAWCDTYGRITERTGEVKPAAVLEGQAERSLREAIDSLGMSPVSRARLGLDVARSFDLAAHWARAAEEDRRDG